MNEDLPPLALTMGEPAGIGAEITVKTWNARRSAKLPPFIYIGDPRLIDKASPLCGLTIPTKVLKRAQFDTAEISKVFDEALPVIPVEIPNLNDFAFGRSDRNYSACVIAALATAVAGCRTGQYAGMVTNPIHKNSLWKDGFSFPGHTEYLSAAFDRNHTENEAIMMLMHQELRVVLVTVHLPLKDVASHLTIPRIVTMGRRVADALRDDFGCPRPRLAVAALNPHGGEEGGLGTEEHDIIAPAVAELRRLGVAADGPFPADTLFHEARRKTYDAVLCMYHDQALIPLKTIDFDTGVNVTLGLPIVRTSPDHGTAFDIAGTGKAKPDSLIAAFQTAAAIARRRRERQAGG